MPIQQYRFGDGAARARALVEAGVTGRLYTAAASTWWRRDRAHYDESPWRGTWAGALGGTVVNHAIHIHDLLTWIGGPLVELQARMVTRVNDTETEDCAVAIGRTADGGLVTMNATTGAATESSRLVWHFEHVTIESSTEAYDPAKEPWHFAFRSADAEQRAAAIWDGMESAPGAVRRAAPGLRRCAAERSAPGHRGRRRGHHRARDGVLSRRPDRRHGLTPIARGSSRPPGLGSRPIVRWATRTT